MGTRERRYGIFTWFGYSRPFEEKLDLIKAAGFHAICSWWGDDFIQLDGPKEDHAGLVRQKGLFLENAHLPYQDMDLLWEDSPAGEGFLEELENQIAAAAHAEIPVLVLHPYRSWQVFEEGSRALFMKRAGRLGETAGRLEIKLAWENLKESLVLRSILDHLEDQSATGFCLDTGHANISRDGAISLLSDYPAKLLALHLHDNNGKEDQHLLPGEGNFPWPVFMDLLSKTGFQGSLMLESCSPFDAERAAREGIDGYLEPELVPEDYLARAVQACRRLEAMRPGGQSI